jgi:hypothetical protein
MDISSFPTLATMSWPELVGTGIVLGVFSLLMEAAYRDRLGVPGRVVYLAMALPLAWWVGPHYGGPFLEQVAPPLFASTPTRPHDRASLRVYERLAQVPEWQQRTRGLSREDKDKLGFELSRKGSARLDDESLQSLAVWLREALANVDPPVCAAMLRGTATPAQLRQALEKLDRASLEAYMDASFNAIVAELKDIEAPKVSSAEHEAAARALLERVPKDWRSRLLIILQMPRFRSDEEVCWAGRTVTYYVTSLSDRDQRAMMRAIVQ